MKYWLTGNRRFWLGVLLLFLCASGCVSQLRPGPFQPIYPYRGLNENTIIGPR
jgi:hypothetical protein